VRIFAISDLHVDYEENMQWLLNLPIADYRYDILILAGDVTDRIEDMERVFRELTRRFMHVLFVPGNHDLWVRRSSDFDDSCRKFDWIRQLASDYGIHMTPFHLNNVSFVPLHGWYDYSFGLPSADLYVRWADFSLCQWPEKFGISQREQEITAYFSSLNSEAIQVKNQFIISYSHFLPRADLIPSFVPDYVKSLLPVMGAKILEQQVRALKSNIHIYGHSHLNRRIVEDSTLYINNAFGYPQETRITAKQLLCVYEA